MKSKVNETKMPINWPLWGVGSLVVSLFLGMPVFGIFLYNQLHGVHSIGLW
jgi:hypothetical protein